jgi:hypothetical protein
MRLWLVVLLLVGFTAEAGRPQRVRSYVTKRGKYVSPSYRTKANKTKTDNYSAKGSANPFTGKKGGRR